MVQITEELFGQLCHYFLQNDEETEIEDYNAICSALLEKREKIQRREAYAAYKAAKGDTEKEACRQAYLDAAGMKDSYRWSPECEKIKNSP